MGINIEFDAFLPIWRIYTLIFLLKLTIEMSEINIIKFLLMQRTADRAGSMGWSIKHNGNVVTLRKKKSELTSLEQNTEVFVNMLLFPAKFRKILKKIKNKTFQ